MRILVCGGRTYSDRQKVYDTLDLLSPPPITVIHGAARGADTLAADWAALRNVPAVWGLADWKAYGRSAGPIRNQRMLNEGKPDLVVAFPGGRGTADMIKRARTAGVPVIEV